MHPCFCPTGELWTRSWDTLPLPDLSLGATDAAALVSEVAAVGSDAGAGAGRAAWSRPPSVRGQPFYPGTDSRQDAGARGNNVPRGSAVGMVRDTHGNGNRARGKKRAWGDSDSDSDASQGGPLSHDEDSRRQRRAGRFKDGTADGVKGRKGAIVRGAMRRAKLSALLDDVGDGGDVDWNAFAIKVRGSTGHTIIVQQCFVNWKPF